MSEQEKKELNTILNILESKVEDANRRRLGGEISSILLNLMVLYPNSQEIINERFKPKEKPSRISRSTKTVIKNEVFGSYKSTKNEGDTQCEGCTPEEEKAKQTASAEKPSMYKYFDKKGNEVSKEEVMRRKAGIKAKEVAEKSGPAKLSDAESEEEVIEFFEQYDNPLKSMKEYLEVCDVKIARNATVKMCAKEILNVIK